MRAPSLATGWTIVFRKIATFDRIVTGGLSAFYFCLMCTFLIWNSYALKPEEL